LDRIYKIAPFLIAIIGIFAAQQWLEITITNQYLIWIVESLLLGVFALVGWRSRKLKEYHMPWQIAVYLAMVVISAVYGVFMSENYWDHKLLVINFLTYMLGISVFFFIQPSKVAFSLRIWLYISAVAFWILLPFMQGECVGRFLLPVSFMLLFFPYYRKSTIVILLILTACVFFFGSMGARSNVLRFLICGAIGIGVYFRSFFSAPLLKLIVVFEFILPVVLLILGVTGVFNVFNISDYFKGSDIEVSNSFDSDNTENISEDTRTFIYIEEAMSAINNGYLIQGRSLARGYDSDYFGSSDAEMSGRGERGSCEVSILNVFNYFGVIGVIVYLILFWGAVKSVFKKSMNKTMYFVAVFIGYKWIWAFVEDFSNFDMNNICMWMALAMCYSPFFLKMSDKQFANWARRIINL